MFAKIFSWLTIALFAACILIDQHATAQQRRPPPVAAYTEESLLRAISLSPDGRKLAFIRHLSDNLYGLAVVDLVNNNKTLLAINENKDQLLANVRWVSPTRLVVSIITKAKLNGLQLPFARMVAMNADGSNQVGLMTNRQLRDNFNLSRIASLLPKDPNHILAYGYDSGPALFRVNVFTGDAKRVVKGKSNTVGWVLNQDGEPRIRFDYSSFSETIKIYAFDEDRNRWQRILKIRRRDIDQGVSLTTAGINQKGDVLVLDRKGNEDFISLHKFDLDTNEISDTVYHANRYDISDTLTDTHTGEVIGISYVSERPHHIYFDRELQAVQQQLERRFPNGLVSIRQTSQDKRRFLVYVTTPWRPGSYYVFDAKDKSEILISNVSDQLSEAAYTYVEVIKYPSNDGKEIEGYLTLPVDRDPKNLPLIVYPHGGPQARDWLTYNPFVQFWAGRGYAVLQPNFRGSTGYGRKFEEAGYKEYGDQIIEDIAAGVKALVKDGYADPERVCAAGGSFGGYAALALSAFKPNLIKCAVSINGLSDLPLHIETKLETVKSRELREEFKEYYDLTLGNLDTQRDLLERV